MEADNVKWMSEEYNKTNNEETIVKKKRPVCRHCGTKLTYRMERDIAVKLFLFFLPLKKYMCTNCRQTSYKID